MKVRSHQPEIVDLRELTDVEVASTYGFLAFINRIGGARAILNELRRMSRGWPGPVRILDVAGGGADIPRAIVRWARRAGLRVSIVSLDSSPGVLRYARRVSREFPEIRFVRGDARTLPFAAAGFDYVICSLFLHHLTDEGARALLADFDRLAARGIVVSDAIRRRRAVFWVWFLTLFGNKLVHYDGPLSVRRAFTIPEIEAVAARAGVGWARVRPVFGHHFVLSGERPGGGQVPARAD